MLTLIADYFDSLSRALILSRNLDNARLVSDEAYRQEIVNYLGTSKSQAKSKSQSNSGANTPTGTGFAGTHLPKAA